MRARQLIEDKIKKAAEKLGLDTGSFVVEHPAEESRGDYASNVALVGGRGNPREKAAGLVEELLKDKELRGVVEKIEVAGPGFINFRLSDSWLASEIQRIVEEGESFGRNSQGVGKRVLVEYSSPNIAKRFGVGQFRSTIYGQVVRNLYEFSGWETVGDNHLGDWGTQFGMMIAAIEEKRLDVSTMSVEEMEELYVEYNKKVKEDEKALEKARDAFARLEGGDKEARKIWKIAVDKSMEEFEEIYKLLGVKIENAYGESAYEGMLPEVIKEMKDKGLVRESEGALIVEFDDLPPAMLLKSNKTTTYFTRDMATIKFRLENHNLKSDLYIYEVGAEQQLHLKQVFAAAEKMGWAKKTDFVHITHGLILGKDGQKMSTRKGTTIKVEEWLMEMIGKAGEINKESAKEVGIGAVKYFDLKHDPRTSYKFDWEEALKLQGDSGPYLQYSVVRARSVLEKAKKSGAGWKGDLKPEERDVATYLSRFPEVVEEATRAFSPNLICSYLYELAVRFNRFYGEHQILGAENEAGRVALTSAVSMVLSNGLGLLGIEIPKKM